MERLNLFIEDRTVFGDEKYFGDMSQRRGNGLPGEKVMTMKTDIELVQLMCLKASSCSLMRSWSIVDKINWLRRQWTKLLYLLFISCCISRFLVFCARRRPTSKQKREQKYITKRLASFIASLILSTCWRYSKAQLHVPLYTTWEGCGLF